MRHCFELLAPLVTAGGGAHNVDVDGCAGLSWSEERHCCVHGCNSWHGSAGKIWLQSSLPGAEYAACPALLHAAAYIMYKGLAHTQAWGSLQSLPLLDDMLSILHAIHLHARNSPAILVLQHLRCSHCSVCRNVCMLKDKCKFHMLDCLAS